MQGKVVRMPSANLGSNVRIFFLYLIYPKLFLVARTGLGSAWLGAVDRSATLPFSRNWTTDGIPFGGISSHKFHVYLPPESILHGPFSFTPLINSPCSVTARKRANDVISASFQLLWCGAFVLLGDEHQGGHVTSVRNASLHHCKTRFSAGHGALSTRLI